MTTETIMFGTMTVLNLVGAVLLMLGMHSYQLRKISPWYKIALACAVFGLVWQAVRNAAFIITGVPTANNVIPFWYMKDLSWVIMGLYFGYLFKNKDLTVTKKKVE